jgi:hypothetical protein
MAVSMTKEAAMAASRLPQRCGMVIAGKETMGSDCEVMGRSFDTAASRLAEMRRDTRAIGRAFQWRIRLAI